MVSVLETWLSGLKRNTAQGYGEQLRRLFSESNMTPEQVLASVESEFQAHRFDTYVKLKGICKDHKASISSVMLFALRRFLYNHGEAYGLSLPPAKFERGERTRPDQPLTWDQALSIIAACGKPYNLICKMLLFNGWGLGQFFQFNTAENWEHVKQFLANPNSGEYFRFNFTGRKKNATRWYSLIPRSLLVEVAGNVEVPLRADHGKGIVLDMNHYRSARTYVESAWKTGLKRAPVTLQATTWPHELRDTFRTRATITGCASDAAEFAMGHTVDPLNYNKCYNDEKWMWNELRKIYGPAAASVDQLKERDGKIAELEQKVQSLEAAQKLLNRLDEIITPELIQKWKDEGKKVVISSKEYERRRRSGESNIDIFVAKTGKKSRKSKV